MRRSAEIIEARCDTPLFLMNVPATWQTPTAARMYRDELVRLGRFLPACGGTEPTERELADTMLRYDTMRADLRALRANMSPGQWARAAARFNRTGEVPEDPEQRDMPGAGVPLALVGGPLRGADFGIFDLIERAGGTVVLDATAGGEMTLPAPLNHDRLKDDPLGELVEAYFGSIPHPMRRPNSLFHEYLKRELADRGAKGVIYRRYQWCDTWHGEVGRLSELLLQPVLDLAAGDDESDRAHVSTRIHAFVEMLQ